MQDSIEAKLIKLSERLSEIEKQLIEESSTLNQDDLISLIKSFRIFNLLLIFIPSI